MGMCKSLFVKYATKIHKTLKPDVGNYSNFTIIFHTMWRYASDFFKVLLKFKMAAMDKTSYFL